jgi:hypothetical protein
MTKMERYFIVKVFLVFELLWFFILTLKILRKKSHFSKKKMSTLEEVFKNCNENHVFKKCKSEETGHDCIVMLEKPTNYFLCNESRKSVINKNMAKFRCNGIVVVTIFDLVSRVTVNSIMHKTEILFIRTTFIHVNLSNPTFST